MTYHEAFDRLGNQAEQQEQWTSSDLLRCLVAVLLVISAIFMWVR